MLDDEKNTRRSREGVRSKQKLIIMRLERCNWTEVRGLRLEDYVAFVRRSGKKIIRYEGVL